MARFDLRLHRPGIGAWLVELFATLNLAFLALDIYLAHSINSFSNPFEWLPVVFACSAPLPLLPGLVQRRWSQGFARIAGLGVGGLAIFVGVLGLMLHLRSTFFVTQTLHALVYTAPFAAPLAFTGVGFLLLLNRMVQVETEEWARWIVFLAMAGFVGNFALSLADHAQNGFFDPLEWTGVGAAAFGASFLLLAAVAPVDAKFLRLAGMVMLFQALVGLAGFALHLHADIEAQSGSFEDALLYGAPLFAPLLFANLAALGGLGLWFRHRTLGANEASSTESTAKPR